MPGMVFVRACRSTNDRWHYDWIFENTHILPPRVLPAFRGGTDGRCRAPRTLGAAVAAHSAGRATACRAAAQRAGAGCGARKADLGRGSHLAPWPAGDLLDTSSCRAAAATRARLRLDTLPRCRGRPWWRLHGACLARTARPHPHRRVRVSSAQPAARSREGSRCRLKAERPMTTTHASARSVEREVAHYDAASVGMRDYAVFGGRLRSEIDFPELVRSPGEHPDWTFRVSSRQPPATRVELVGERRLGSEHYRLSRADAGFRLEYSHAGTFDIS